MKRKRKRLTAEKAIISKLVEVKEIFVDDITTEVLMRGIPTEPWDQTGMGNWTMQAGAKVVLIVHVDDKRQATAVLQKENI